MSFVATGLVWQWMLNPELGVQEVLHGSVSRTSRFDWIVDQDAVMYALVIAAVWQASGLVMALMLAGLRGIDESLWKAARIDGIPPGASTRASCCRCSGRRSAPRSCCCS
jgi:glucose/mannose transport system permease protein